MLKPPSQLRTSNFPLTLAAPSFINDSFLPMFAARCARAIRSVRLPSALVEQFAAERIIDVAVSIGIEGRLPKTWSSEAVGEVHYGLFGAPGLVQSLGPTPTREEICRIPFVVPLYVRASGVLEVGDDRCPLGRDERLVGHEVESIGLACYVAAQTDHLVYGPRLAAAPLVREGALVELASSDLGRSDPLLLACSPDGITASVHEALASTLRTIFASAHPSSIVPVSPVRAWSAAPASRRGRT